METLQLNRFFSDCFSLSQPPLTPDDLREFQPTGECAEALLCSEEEILCMLNSLDTTKANGLDGVSARMLKSTGPSIAPVLFNFSIHTVYFPQPWKISSIVPIPKHQCPTNYTDQFHYFQY